MELLELWNKLREVPKRAKKTIQAGRLKGMTDIKPQWRYELMTEHFGPVGFGWKYEITKQWIEEGSEGQKSAFTNINLYVKYNDQWSEAIPGTGGSQYIASESRGLYTSDEAFKMSLTDALSVAMKALGVAADVYNGLSDSKYDKKEENYKPHWWNDAIKYLNTADGDIEKIVNKYNLSEQVKQKLLDDAAANI